MNAEIKAQWLTDLRSGEFQKGKGYLQGADGRFCCLGVLCEQAVKAGVAQKAQTPDGSWEYAGIPREGSMAYGDCSVGTLPNAVRDWANLLSNNPRVRVENGFPLENLSEVNDETTLEFPAIADLIEAQL